MGWKGDCNRLQRVEHCIWCPVVEEHVMSAWKPLKGSPRSAARAHTKRQWHLPHTCLVHNLRNIPSDSPVVARQARNAILGWWLGGASTFTLCAPLHSKPSSCLSIPPVKKTTLPRLPHLPPLVRCPLPYALLQRQPVVVGSEPAPLADKPWQRLGVGMELDWVGGWTGRWRRGWLPATSLFHKLAVGAGGASESQWSGVGGRGAEGWGVGAVLLAVLPWPQSSKTNRFEADVGWVKAMRGKRGKQGKRGKWCR